MTESVDPISIEDEPTVSVGQQLIQVREAKKLSLTEVATQLRLTKNTITYLETQQWEKLHGRAYTRGYFVNYVKFLGLNEEEMLAAFNADYNANEPNLNVSKTLMKTEKSLPWTGIVFILLAIVITGFAYQNWKQSQGQDTGILDELDELVVPWESSGDDGGETKEPEEFESSVVEPIQEQAASLALNQNNVDESLVTEIEVISEVSPEETVLEAEVLTEDENVQSINETELTLFANHDCWVEVTDAEKKILFYNMIKADDTVVVAGKPPISVLLGSALGIQVKVDGVPFDTSSFITGDVARFTVGIQS